MRIWKYLITLQAISFFLFLTSFGQVVERISVGVDKNFYKIFLTFNGKPYYKLLRDSKRDIITLKVENSYRFSKEFYSVKIVGDRNLITVFVRNPKLQTSKAFAIRKYKTLIVYIPFKRNKPAKYVVVIDPGHGGRDTGAIYYGVEEKNINLSIAKKLYELLREDGRFKVYLTRKGDYFISLAGRQKFTAKVGADLFISIHANANPYNRSKRGVEFYVLSDRGKYRKFVDLATHPDEAEEFIDGKMVKDKSLRKKVIKTALEFTQEEGEEFAEILRRFWCKNLERVIPCGKIYKRSFAVLKVPGVPTVLVEVGYMSNYRELKILLSNYYQWKIAETIYKAILDYFNLSPKRR